MTSTGPVEPPSREASGTRLPLTEWCFAGLLLLALLGIGVTDFSSRNGLWYWLGVAPVFAGVSVGVGWSRARAAGQNVSSILVRQLLHWTALAPALAVVYVFEHTGRLNREDAGLVSLLALALTTLTAGVHFDWRLAALGALLGVASVAAALVEEFFWMLLIPVLLVAVVLYFRRKRSNGRAETLVAPETSN